MKLSCTKNGPRSICVLRWGAEGFYYVVVGIILFYSVCRIWALYEGYGDMEAVFEGSEEAWVLLGVSSLALAPTLFVGSFAMIWRAGLVSLGTGLTLFMMAGDLVEPLYDLDWAIIAGVAPLTLLLNGLVLARLRSVVTLDPDRGILTCHRHHFIGSDLRSLTVSDETAVVYDRVYSQVYAGRQGSEDPMRTNIHGTLGISVSKHDVIPLGSGARAVLRHRGRVMADFLGLPFREGTRRDADETEIL